MGIAYSLYRTVDNEHSEKTLVRIWRVEASIGDDRTSIRPNDEREKGRPRGLAPTGTMCENGPSNRINPRPVNPFIGVANPVTGHERVAVSPAPFLQPSLGSSFSHPTQTFSHVLDSDQLRSAKGDLSLGKLLVGYRKMYRNFSHSFLLLLLNYPPTNYYQKLKLPDRISLFSDSSNFSLHAKIIIQPSPTFTFDQIGNNIFFEYNYCGPQQIIQKLWRK